MDIFTAIGFAVVGIFITVIASGILAGIVAYGMIDGRGRAKVQRTVISQLVNEPIKLLLDEQTTREWLLAVIETTGIYRGKFEHLWLTGHVNLVPRLIGMPSESFYSLPYRQLCGQVATRVSADIAALSTENRQASPLAAIMALSYMCRNEFRTDLDRWKNNPEGEWRRPGPSAQELSDAALSAIDSMQVVLADATDNRAAAIGFLVVLVIFSALLIPSATQLYVFNDPSNFLFQATGLIVTIVISTVLLLVLAFGALIVSRVTFRWVDRFASAR